MTSVLDYVPNDELEDFDSRYQSGGLNPPDSNCIDTTQVASRSGC